MTYANKVVYDVNRYIDSEIEKRVVQWIESARGVDFSKLLTDKLKENEQLKSKIEAVNIYLDRNSSCICHLVDAICDQCKLRRILAK